MDNNNNINSGLNCNEALENDHPAPILVIFLPLFFLAIFLSLLLIALCKSEEKRDNIIRIMSYILIQFVCLPFLIIFIIVNLVLISLSFLCFKKLNYISTKKAFEYCKGCLGYFSKRDVTTIKIGKRVHNVPNSSSSANYKDVNDNSKSNDHPLHLNRVSENLNLNKNSININSNSLNNNNNIAVNNNNNFNNEQLNLRTTGIANSNLNNFDSHLHCENDKEKNLSGLEKINKEPNINNNNLNDDVKDKYNSNLVKSDIVNKNNNKNLIPNYKTEKIENDSNSNKQENKVNIFMSIKDARPQPGNKKANKSKIMEFLNDVLVNKDNTPSYINLFKNIKDKSKEKLEKTDVNNVVIFHK